MAKASGSTRTITSGVTSVAAAHSEFAKEMGSGRYDVSQSYFSEESGGYVLALKGRKPNASEAEAAKAMANDGLYVRLTPEGGVEFRTGKSNKGNYTYADGLVMGRTYEQKTPSPQSTTDIALANSIDRALQHARLKNAQVPLIYDRGGNFHRQHIEAGLKQFENNSPYRFRAIFVVNKNGKVYEHQHNK